MVLTNGKILTVDASDSVAQAVAITGGRIVAVGTADQVKSRIGPSTRVIDLHGRTVTPGLLDSHVHFQEVDALYTVDLSDLAIKKMDDVLARVRDQVSRLKPGEWVRGRGWDEGKLAEKRAIFASDLDKVAPDNPVWLTHASGHFGVANSYAMRLAKITNSTKDPEAGTIDRDAQGNATGVMKETAKDLITTLIPPFTKEQQRNGLLKIIEDFNKEGMTGAKDPGIDRAKWDLYREVLNDNKLNVRVFVLWSGGTSVDSAKQALANIQAQPKLPTSLGDGRLYSGGVKIYMDGAVTAHTAWVYDEWFNNAAEKDKGNVGYPSTEPNVYRQMVQLLHEAGVHVSTHAIGDRAIDWVVDTYDQVLRAKPTRGLRHGIIHASIPTDRAIDVMARLQKEYDAAYPEANSPFMWWLGDNLVRSLGADRVFRMMPFASYEKKGVIFTSGSDYSVTPFPARNGIWTSVARKTLSGAMPFGVEQSVDIKTSLRAYTIWSAHQMFMENRVGSIEVGKDADIAVWDRDLYTVPTDQLKDMKCELTLLQGRVVYRDPRSPVTGF
jgi:predicted amidohydrolase YtcJ